MITITRDEKTSLPEILIDGGLVRLFDASDGKCRLRLSDALLDDLQKTIASFLRPIEARNAPLQANPSAPSAKT